jgi:hypothetical protein
LATVHGNSQMAGLLLGQGHSAIETQVAGAQETLSQAITQLFARWKSTGLADNGRPSPYTTQAAVDKLLGGLMAEITA